MNKLLISIALLLLPGFLSAETLITQATNSVTVTPTVDTSAYAAGDTVNTAVMTFAGACKTSNPYSIVQDVIISDLSKQANSFDLLLFNSAVSGYGDANAAFDPADADLAYLEAIIPISTNSNFNDSSVAYGANLARVIKCDSAGKIYGVLVSRATPTYGAASDVSVTISFLQQ
jgi:hypothetical protein